MSSTTGTGSGGTVAVDETSRLIASDKVEGTAVYNAQGERMGSIYTLMIDKYSGQVSYAVMSFGGFLGIGERPHLRHAARRLRRGRGARQAYGRAQLRLGRDALERPGLRTQGR